MTVLLAATASVAAGQSLDELLAAARPVGRVPAFENEYVRVYHAVLEYPEAPAGRPDARPVVLYVRVLPDAGVVNTSLLRPPPGARAAWRPGVVPRGVDVELLAPPPAPPALGGVGADLPRGATEDGSWDGGRLVLATYRPLDYGAGTGRYPSVTTFLSDGVVEVTERGARRRMAVQAGDAFWLAPATRLTVIDDYPVGAAIVQLLPRR